MDHYFLTVFHHALKRPLRLSAKRWLVKNSFCPIFYLSTGAHCVAPIGGPFGDILKSIENLKCMAKEPKAGKKRAVISIPIAVTARLREMSPFDGSVVAPVCVCAVP